MYRIFIFCFLTTLLFFNCEGPKPTTSTSIETVTFKGKIEHATQQQINITTPFERMTVDIKAGEFEVKMPLPYAVVADFQYYKNTWKAYGKPGETIEISFKEGDFDNTFKVSKYQKENEFITELGQQLAAPQNNFAALFGQKEGDFMKTIDSLNFAGIASVLKFTKDNPKLDRDLKQWLNFMVVYASGENLQLYPNVHQMVTRDTSYKPSPSFKSIQQKVNSERPELLGHPNYKAFLDAKLNNATSAEWEKMPEGERKFSDYLKAQMVTINKHFNSPELKEALTFGAIERQLLFSGVNGVNEYLTPFLKNAKNDFYKNKLEELYGKWAHLEKGKAAPNFTYPDLEQTLHSLSDYKGKYVYIDVWATWCGPCLAEQPALAKIEEEFKDNPNIVFMGVSTDANKQAWQNMVKDRGLKGVQLLAGRESQVGISKDYNISGIPRFILVDKAGNIIDANADRPSSGSLKAQLEELLGD